jgi:hypothetical protein
MATAAASASSSATSVSSSAVKADVAWPSISLMALIGTPAASAIVAEPGLSPCSVTGGRPSLETSVSNRSETAALGLPPRPEHVGRALVDADDAVGVLALGAVELVVDLRLPDMGAARREVDVGPAQADSGYYAMYCYCGKHHTNLHKTPSNPDHFKQRVRYMISLCSKIRDEEEAARRGNHG